MLSTMYVYPGNKTTTWAEGRNILFERAKKTGRKYKYYIFLDDDVKLAYSEGFPKAKQQGMSPVRAFEKFLADYEPVVGLTDYSSGVYAVDLVLSQRRRLCNHSGPSKPLHISIVHFDAVFNVFHPQSLDYLLPYNSNYDHECWWHTQRDIIAKVEIVFRGQAVIFAPVLVLNQLHRNYPRENRNASRVWSLKVDKIAQQMSVQYRGENILKEFKANPINYTENSLTVCLNLPPYFPIVPFQHF